MKKVLIIANLSHASPRISGLAKYLPEFGWEPIILTGSDSKRGLHQPPDEIFKKYRIIQTPCPNIVPSLKRKLHLNPNQGFQEQIGIPLTFREARRSFTNRLIILLKGIIAYPDEYKNWKPFAMKAGSNLLQKENIDAIISSSSPVTSHIIANELRGECRIPWVADLRDLWTQNHNYKYGLIRKFFEQKLELKTLKEADVLVTVSQPLKKRLQNLHKGKKTYTITNGFDPEKVNIPPADLIDKFTITYTGQIYTGKQNFSKLLIALKDLIFNGTINPNDIKVRFYGPNNESLERQIKSYRLSAIINQYGIVPRETSLKKQWESQILLLFTWEDERIEGGYTGKIFEYLAAQRPILATGSFGSDVEKIFNQTKAGVYISNVEEIKKNLREFYLKYKQNGKVTYNGNWTEIQKYSHREMARKFADILNKVI